MQNCSLLHITYKITNFSDSKYLNTPFPRNELGKLINRWHSWLCHIAQEFQNKIMYLCLTEFSFFQKLSTWIKHKIMHTPSKSLEHMAYLIENHQYWTLEFYMTKINFAINQENTLPLWVCFNTWTTCLHGLQFEWPKSNFKQAFWKIQISTTKSQQILVTQNIWFWIIFITAKFQSLPKFKYQKLWYLNYKYTTQIKAVQTTQIKVVNF